MVTLWAVCPITSLHTVTNNMAKHLLHLNPESPYNMRMTSMPYHRLAEFGTEDDMIAAVIARLRSSGTVGADVVIHTVDTSELPDYYFFDAWEWS